MEPEVLKYLHDVPESIDRLLTYATHVTTIEQFEDNLMLKDAVERRLSIIGEALYQAPKIDKDIPVSHKNKNIALKHIIVQERL